MKNDDKPNFLTCPAFPELEAPVQAKPVESQSPLQKAIPPVQQVASRTIPRLRSRQATHGPRKRTALWISLVILVLLGILTGPALVALARAGISAQSAKSALDRAVGHARDREYASAGASLGDAQLDLLSVRQALGGVGFWRDVPTVGTQIRALEDAAAAGIDTLDGARDLLTVAASLVQATEQGTDVTEEIGLPVEAHRTFNDLTPEEKRSILAKLDRALPDIRVAQAKISVALEKWNRVPQNELFAPLKSALAPVAENLPRLKKSLDEAVPLIELILPLAGYPKPSNYVVVLQNSEEMRATGGFLGTVGVLQVDGGDVKQFVFDDVYNLDNPAKGKWNEAPPEPLRKYNAVPVLFFRDANWSPDFPTSAGKLIDFYTRELEVGTGRSVAAPDGLIALNPPFFKDLIRITGPIQVDEFTFNQDNFFDLLQYESEVGFLREGKIPISRRKDIVVRVGNVLMYHLASLPASRWAELLDATTRALDRKQIQVYARDPALLARLDARGWTGRAKATQGDFLWVVDTNLAALKTDGVMTKRVEYSLNAKDPSGPIATVTLRYTNNAKDLGKTEYRYTRYRDYVRLYVPEGATLVSVKGAMLNDRYLTGGRVVEGPVDVFRDLGKTVFAAFWSIEPRQTQEIVFTYRLPPSVSDQIAAGSYRLDWPKQSGNDDVALTLSHEFGKTLQHATPSEDPEHFGDSTYEVTSDSQTDNIFGVTF